MVHHARIIILNITRLGEKSLVLHCLTREWGRRSFIVSVSRHAGMSYFLPMNILDCEVTENPRSDLWRASGMTVSHPLGGIRSDVRKNTMTLFLSEVLYRTIREDAYEEGLFDWCERSILTLDALDSAFSNYHLRFLLEFCAVLGFSPSSIDLAPFAGEHLRQIQSLVELPYGESLLFPLNGADRNAIAEILLKYLSYHTDSRIESKSLPVLRELFA